MTYTKNSKLSGIIINNIKAASVFEKHNINYCINGGRSLEEACGYVKIKPDEVIKELKNINGAYTGEIKVNEWSLDFLCDYIETNHHAFIRKTFPKMLKHSKKIFKDNNEDALKILEQLKRDFEIHMQKEERLLFPYIKRLADSEYMENDFEIAPFGLIKKPVLVMKKEHLSAHEKVSLLKKSFMDTKKIKGSIRIKNDLLKLFDEFEFDFHIHLHLENNILFPKAILLENKILKKITKNK
ncbi:MAG TPA: DUF542 domain-containing protein [Ignavibacteria bacterium]|nr:DUF542 domain-containing protein [Ignavibacteria bacterium]HMR41168.1 DUF542 domain-containing protein [Ignavibacteria bacterium]